MVEHPPEFPEPIKAEAEATEKKKPHKGRPQSLESLLVDDEDNDPVGSLAGREIKVVSLKGRRRSWPFTFCLLFCLLSAGSALVYVKIVSRAEPYREPVVTQSQRFQMPPRPEVEAEQIPGEKTVGEGEATLQADVVLQETSNKTLVVDSLAETHLYSVAVGPFLNQAELDQATGILSALGLQAQSRKGRGAVKMIRLRAGDYSESEAPAYLANLKKHVSSAFLLPEGSRKVLYAGSFHDQTRARQLQQELASKNMTVSPVEVEIAMDGVFLDTLKVDQQTAQQLSEHLRDKGLTARITEFE